MTDIVALEPQQLISRVIMRGAAIPADISSAVVESDIQLDATQISQLNITFNDDDFSILKTGYFGKGTPIDYLDLRLVVSTISTQASASGKGQVTIGCRPAVIQALRNRRGALVMRNVSASQFIQAECAAVGASCVVQPSVVRTSIARDVYVPGQTDADSSSWTTFTRLGSEEGYYIWETAGVVYFGKPSWFMKTATELQCIWSIDPNNNSPYLMASCPTFNTSLDSVTNDANGTIEVPIWRAMNFRPGYVANVQGCGMFDGRYFVQSVNYPLTNGGGTAEVDVVVPLDPTPDASSVATTSSGSTPDATSSKIDDVVTSVSNSGGQSYVNGGQGGHNL